MVKTAVFAKDIDTNLLLSQTPFTYLPKVAAPFTTIVNRALVTDASADGLPRFGVGRYPVQQVMEVPGEFGPNGERVFKPINDVHDVVRFAGNISFGNTNQGQFISGGTVGDFIEITFYGTGLNLLCFVDTNARTVSVTVDGFAAASVNLGSVSYSGALTIRRYSQNVPISIVSDLTLGLHTVKMAVTVANFVIYGYEVLNTTPTLQLVPATSFAGGNRLYKPTLTTDAYNSNFESGTLGTRGGHVLVYQKSDGTTAKAVTPTNISAAFLASSDHTNEQILGPHHFREFGAGGTDDYSSLALVAGNRAFTLDDGTTSLVGLNVRLPIGFEAVGPFTLPNDFLTFTFVGTGLDIKWTPASTGTNTNANAFEFFVDGVSVGNMETTVVSIQSRIKKIASGLPYGTHCVRVLRNTPDLWTFHVQEYIVYGPRTPTLPPGAVALADYFLMADFVSQVTAGADRISTGVLRKALSTREALYSGTWAAPTLSVNATSGFITSSSTASSYIEYVFFGTGFDFRFTTPAPAASYTVTIDGTNPTAAGATTTGFYNGVTSFTAATGVIVVGAALSGSGVTASGLTLGKHTVRVTYTSGNALQPESLDIITPLHAPKSTQPGDVQNTLMVGSCALSDDRVFSNLSAPVLKNYAQAVGVTSGPTTTSPSFVPMPEMSVVIRTTGNPIRVAYQASLSNGAGQGVFTQIYVDGSPANIDHVSSAAASIFAPFATDVLIPAAAGVHKIDLYWRVDGGTGTASGVRRSISAAEET